MFSSGDVLSRVFRIYRDQWAVLLGAAAIVYLIDLVAALLIGILAGIVALIAAVFYQGMVVDLVRDVQDGRRDSSLGQLFSSVKPVAFPLLAVAIVFGICVGIGLILLIIPGLYLLTIWAVAAPVVVIERPGVFTSFGRSRQLVRGHGWTVFGVIVLVFLITIGINILAAALADPLGDVGRALIEWVASAITSPLAALAASVLYFELIGAEHPEEAPSYPSVA